MAHPDYEEFVAALNAHGVRYLIVGAHALALHARPRATKDLDIVIASSKANAKRAADALRAFFGGTAPAYASVDNLRDPETIIQLGVAPVRIDLISTLGSTTFTKAFNKRVQARFGNVPAAYLSLDDLLAEKRHWARPQDIADIEVLERAKGRGRLRTSTAARARGRGRSMLKGGS
jgi:hypothetical protein